MYVLARKHSNLGANLICAVSTSTSHGNRCWDDERPRRDVGTSSLGGRGEGWLYGTICIYTNPAQITSALIHPPKWERASTSLCLYSTKFFARHLFWRVIPKTRGFQQRNALLQPFGHFWRTFLRLPFALVILRLLRLNYLQFSTHSKLRDVRNRRKAHYVFVFIEVYQTS